MCSLQGNYSDNCLFYSVLIKPHHNEDKQISNSTVNSCNRINIKFDFKSILRDRSPRVQIQEKGMSDTWNDLLQWSRDAV